MELGVSEKEVTKALGELSENQLRHYLDGLERRRGNLEKRIQAARMMVEAKRMFREADEDDASDEPRDAGNVVQLAGTSRPGLTEAVVRILESEPTREWTLGEVFDRMRMNGWTPDAADARRATGSVLSRLARRGDIARVDRRYRFKS